MMEKPTNYRRHDSDFCLIQIRHVQLILQHESHSLQIFCEDGLFSCLITNANVAWFVSCSYITRSLVIRTPFFGTK